jgi:ATP-dependent helicase/nuclease subunit A
MTEILLADSQDRLLAETTWDRNVVVVAGAGTGKTTILVNRILNLLMREPQPLTITDIVALTFTNKAATEMKQRLRRELSKLAEQKDDPLLSLFRSRYHLTTDEVAARASAALDHLEKAQIGTLHSFAAHLLRLHPLEAGIDPVFQEDDGSRFKELFESRWDIWLAEELGPEGRHAAEWRQVLQGSDLENLRHLAEILAGESFDLRELERQCNQMGIEGPLRRWLTEIRDLAVRLTAARVEAKPLKAEKMLCAAERFFSLLLKEGTRAIRHLSPDDVAWLRKDLGQATTEWSEEAFAEAKMVVTTAQQLLTVDQSYFRNLIGLLRPFLHGVQQSFLASGWISFDGLLARAKTLLRDHPAVRARIKQTYRAILVDEFQDTDPVQYEIILYLAEGPGSSNPSWQDVDLEPGKLFIVGDPKQSIYAFRRADIEAFERVVRKILTSGGVAYALTTNFRSDGSVLTVVNDLFDRLFEAEEHTQPSNERLTAKPQRKPELSAPGVQLRLVTAGDEEEFDAAAATRAEADGLARWIKEELLTGTTVVDQERGPGPLQPGHIALVFRKLTQAQDYLDALRRYDIAYLTDGEKHFYRRQEIVDLVNLLRVLDNPHDRIALVGLLRSPLGGIADQDLLMLQQIGGLDITSPATLARWPHQQTDTLKALYERMGALHRLAPTLPVPELLNLIFGRLPVLELAAASLHGEQAVANLLKARDMAEELADRPHLTLTAFVDLMMERLLDQPEEAESALAEASLDAVRILTIHKAKGLEFPVVVLPGLHQGTRNPRKGPEVHYDWSSRCYGLTVGNRITLGAVFVGRKMAAREEAEHRRLLYVGMTRARDLLVLSGGRTQKSTRDTVSWLLQQALGEAVLSNESATVKTGTGRIVRVVLPSTTTARRRPSKMRSSIPVPALPPLLARYRSRQDRWSRFRGMPKRLTPSLMKAGPSFQGSAVQQQGRRARAQLVGICAHALLERWNFSKSIPPEPSEIDSLCRHFISEDIPEIRDDLLSIMTSFLQSDFYRNIRRATILGREIPYVMSWEEGQVMEGVIDVVYRLDGRLWIADYKTDQISAGEAPARAEQYAGQARVYRTAVERCLSESVGGFHFMFLRPGVTVEM